MFSLLYDWSRLLTFCILIGRIQISSLLRLRKVKSVESLPAGQTPSLKCTINILCYDIFIRTMSSPLTHSASTVNKLLLLCRKYRYIGPLLHTHNFLKSHNIPQLRGHLLYPGTTHDFSFFILQEYFLATKDFFSKQHLTKVYIYFAKG